ncbi:MAG: aminomethyl-transferring glycine dehydrogenase subunit GcvPA [Acidobacteria bacterium]|nr:aminomethyl-transferring glycine dehydrogenase subunit GcvPA [Acidobacteriota bacterium]
MLEAVGVASIDALFEAIPAELRQRGELKIAGPQSELEVERHLASLADLNTHSCLSFVGAGAYQHHIPAHVGQTALRSEFSTAYTPYQPEISQGTLQAVFEFQTMMCQLTGLDISNASLYDGATATAEAMLMSNRANDRKTFLIPRSLHPEYRAVCRTYAANLGFNLVEIGFGADGRSDLAEAASAAGADLSAIILQSPNFFGCLEDWTEAARIAHAHDALAVAVTAEALSLALIKSPGECGCDIAVGEAQSFGIPVSFGGPYLGFLAARQKLVRNMPGRLVGQTIDKNGRRGYVLTLATREQHIRREKATSNICTNQGLCALMATIYMATLGRRGLRDLACLNLSQAAYLRKAIESSRKMRVRFSGTCFNELVVDLGRSSKEVQERLQDRGVIAGLPLGVFFPELATTLLLCVTETARREDIDTLVRELEAVL